MGRIRVTRNSFNSGELDPLLASRFDTRAHSQGAATLRNVICLPQGGLRRRGGLEYLATITDGDARLIPFSFSVTQDYMLVFADEKMYVFKDGVLVTDINGSGDDFLTVPWSLAEILAAGWTQSADTLLVFHRDYPPYKITRGATDATWTGADAVFTFKPTEDFNNDYDAVTFTLGAVTGTGISLTASSGVFTAEHVGGRFEGREGVADIVGYASATVVTIDILDDFDNVSQDGKRSFLTEPAWSAEHGYPGAGTFHEGRLWLASTNAQPQTMWGSRTADFFNFDYGTGLDDEAIGVTLDTDQVNQILHLVSNRHLQVLTTGGEFYLAASPTITPSLSPVRRQTTFGASAVRPVTIDGSTLFIQRTGKVVREFLFDFVEDAYRSNSASLLASHLVQQPTDMAGYRGSQVEDANYVYMVNEDGTLSVYNTLREQEIAAWTHWDSLALFKRVAVLNEEVYFLMYFDSSVELLGGEGAWEPGDYHLVRLDNERFLDLFVHNATLNSDITSGLDHLNGETIKVRADGVVLNDSTVSGGSAQLARHGSDVEAGLGFSVEIKTLPLNIDLQDGPAFVKMKRLVSVYADLYQSLSVFIDGFRLADRQFGAGILDQPAEPYTEIRRVRTLGWDRQKTVTITQTDPQPLTLRALTLEVET